MSSNNAPQVSASSQPVKPAPQEAAKVETAEDARRRRAGIACFL